MPNDFHARAARVLGCMSYPEDIEAVAAELRAVREETKARVEERFEAWWQKAYGWPRDDHRAHVGHEAYLAGYAARTDLAEALTLLREARLRFMWEESDGNPCNTWTQLKNMQERTLVFLSKHQPSVEGGSDDS